jgi:hypothetical protein
MIKTCIVTFTSNIGKERRIPFIFDDFHFCRSRVIGLDMTENMIFTLCRMTTWVKCFSEYFEILSAAYQWREEGPFHIWSPPVSDVLGVAFVELSVIIILLTGISRAVAAT